MLLSVVTSSSIEYVYIKGSGWEVNPTESTPFVLVNPDTVLYQPIYDVLSQGLPVYLAEDDATELHFNVGAKGCVNTGLRYTRGPCPNPAIWTLVTSKSGRKLNYCECA